MANSTPRAPSSVSKQSQLIWRKIVSTYDLMEPELVLLKTGLESYDLYQNCLAIITKDGCRAITTGLNFQRVQAR